MQLLHSFTVLLGPGKLKNIKHIINQPVKYVACLLRNKTALCIVRKH
jgi:hypothetical protein